MLCASNISMGVSLRASAVRHGMRPAAQQPAAGSVCRPRAPVRASAWIAQTCRQQQRWPVAPAAAAADGGAEAAPSGIPPAWDLAQRVSADALAMITAGEPFTAELIIKKGLAEIAEQHGEDPSAALLHTQLWNLVMETGDYEAALAAAKAAYDLMIKHFGEDSADAAFHGIRYGISLAVGGGDLDLAQQLLVFGGSTAQHNLENFWNRLQEMQAAGQDVTDMEMYTKKLMVALADANFYGAIALVRKAIENADELDLPMQELQTAWLGGTKQMAMALPPDHPLFAIAQRELGRLIPEAAGRPTMQQELEESLQGVKTLLSLIKQMPESMAASGPTGGAAAAAAAEEDEFLP